MWWCGSWREDRRLPFHRLPVLDPAGLGGEVHPDFEELARVVGEGQGVLPLLDLRQRLLDGFVQLELEEVDVVGGLHHHVHAAVGGVPLGLRVEAHHLEDEGHGIVKVEFGIACQLVILSSKQRFQTLHELVDLSGPYRQYKIFNKTILTLAGGGVISEQKTGKATLHLLVRESELIGSETCVVTLDGKIAALVE